MRSSNHEQQEFLQRGWQAFEHDEQLLHWVRRALPAARASVHDPAYAEWLRYRETWFAAVFYHTRETALSEERLKSLRQLVSDVLIWADRYSVINLAILADEFALDDDEHQALQADFVNVDMTGQDFASTYLDTLLNDERLAACIDAGHVSDKGFVTLYRYEEGKPPVRDYTTLLKYRDTALWRLNIREQLRLPNSIEEREADRAAVLQLYRDCQRKLLRPMRSYAATGTV